MTRTEADREAARKKDGKFGEQQNSAPDLELSDTPTMKLYRDRYWSAGAPQLSAEQDSRQAQMDAISASLVGWYPTATKAQLRWDDGDWQVPASVRLEAVLDADGHVLAHTDSSEELEGCASDIGWFHMVDWKDARSTFDESDVDEGLYTFELNRELPEATPERIRAEEVIKHHSWRSSRTHQLLVQLLDERPDLADKVAPLQLEDLFAVAHLEAQK